MPVAASSPHTNDCGKAMSAIRDMNQNPLASPFAAESHESIVIGDEIGAASDVVSIRPKKDASRTFPALIGRNIQRSGMSAAVRLIEAARSSVRLLQASSFAHRSE